ncbi:unnamed protein product [Fraxinus pennsylvanica]|uniref:Uncharacterized protein n=1 Tax=Fraxinus pennsylvanica TaxID=56036 RepID=A0AAD1Z275_9LAMI|nr:unnamed protein product [Fraxinus pennsylvanica]
MAALWKKFFKLKQGPHWWNRQVFGDIFQWVRDAKDRVDVAETIYDRDLILEHRDLLHQEYAVLNQTLSIEEGFWKQKADSRWDLLSAPTQSLDLLRPNIILRLLMEDDNLALNRNLLIHEVREAVFSIDADSAVGPNGFSS